MARDRPSPYGKGGRSAVKKMSRYRSAGALGCHTRIRAGFPRDRSIDRGIARDRPSPYGERGVLLPRNRPYSVARGPVPRDRLIDRGIARDRPSPYGEGGRSAVQKPSLFRSAGACPPRSFDRPRHSEGQALALRGGETFFHRSAGPSDATRASERVSPRR